MVFAHRNGTITINFEIEYLKKIIKNGTFPTQCDLTGDLMNLICVSAGWLTSMKKHLCTCGT